MMLYVWMIVQILCESLPISSSGHVTLMLKVTEFYQGYRFHDFFLQSLWSFDYLLQGVSAIVFLFYFFSSWWQLIFDKPVSWHLLFEKDIWLKKIADVLLFGIAADGMTFLLWSLDLQNRITIPLFFGFFITQIALLSTKFYHEKKDISIWSYKNGIIVGFVQGCALLPGISRFASTFAVLQFLGYGSKKSFSISFLIQWPLIVAGSLKGFFSLQDHLVISMITSWYFVMTMVVSASIAYGLLYLVQKTIDKNIFWSFSIYMFIPIIMSLCY